jgi:predicted Zn-dependent protease
MYMGRKFGGKHLNFTDGAAIPGLRGSYKYDDEGTLATRTPLVREGELVGRLHSRETAAMLGEKPKIFEKSQHQISRSRGYLLPRQYNHVFYPE